MDTGLTRRRLALNGVLENDMRLPYPAVLTLTERLLTGLSVLNLLYGTALLGLLTASLVAPAWLFTALVGQPAVQATAHLRGLMVIGLLAVPVTQVLLGRLRAILQTVRAGDPFVEPNARRLHHLALAVLALEVLRLAVGALARDGVLAALGVPLDSSLSLTPWISGLLLLVLARVFQHGAQMRAELQGVV